MGSGTVGAQRPRSEKVNKKNIRATPDELHAELVAHFGLRCRASRMCRAHQGNTAPPNINIARACQTASCLDAVVIEACNLECDEPACCSRLNEFFGWGRRLQSNCGFGDQILVCDSRARKSKQKSITSLENVTAFPSRLAAAAALDRRYWLSFFGFSLFCFRRAVAWACLAALVRCGLAGWLTPTLFVRLETRHGWGFSRGLVLFDAAFCCAVDISIRVVERSGEG